MIASLEGTVLAKDATTLVLGVGGVGYQLEMTATALAALPSVGSEAGVYTYLQVRDDGLMLFGFTTLEEKELFVKLISVSGIGPKLALAALGTFTPAQIKSAIALEDEKKLTTIPGLGKKTTQRLILELKSAFQDVALDGNDAMIQVASAYNDEAMQALLAMGFSSDEASRALLGFDSAGDTQAAIRYALKNLS